MRGNTDDEYVILTSVRPLNIWLSSKTHRYYIGWSFKSVLPVMVSFVLFEYQPEGEGHGFDLGLLLHWFAATSTSFLVEGYLNCSWMNAEGHSVCHGGLCTCQARPPCEQWSIVSARGHVPDGVKCRTSEIHHRHLKTELFSGLCYDARGMAVRCSRHGVVTAKPNSEQPACIIYPSETFTVQYNSLSHRTLLKRMQKRLALLAKSFSSWWLDLSRQASSLVTDATQRPCGVECWDG